MRWWWWWWFIIVLLFCFYFVYKYSFINTLFIHIKYIHILYIENVMRKKKQNKKISPCLYYEIYKTKRCSPEFCLILPDDNIKREREIVKEWDKTNIIMKNTHMGNFFFSFNFILMSSFIVRSVTKKRKEFFDLNNKTWYMDDNTNK